MHLDPLIPSRINRSLLLGSLILAHAWSSLAAPDQTQNWIWITPGRNGAVDRENILSLQIQGSDVTGKISAPGRDGKPADSPISNGQIQGSSLSFAVIREANGNRLTNLYSATINGDNLTGKIEAVRNGEVQSREWTAKSAGTRSEAAAVAPPKPGYDEAGHKIVNETKYQELTAEAAEAYLKQYPDTVILDLRPPTAYEAGHLAGARSLDVTDDATYRDSLKTLDKSKRYLVHSVSGGYRTIRVFEFFQENSFPNAVAIKGGYQAWTAAGKPVVK
jgi:rhodanese-related sulfurtransferase